MSMIAKNIQNMAKIPTRSFQTCLLLIVSLAFCNYYLETQYNRYEKALNAGAQLE